MAAFFGNSHAATVWEQENKIWISWAERNLHNSIEFLLSQEVWENTRTLLILLTWRVYQRSRFSQPRPEKVLFKHLLVRPTHIHVGKATEPKLMTEPKLSRSGVDASIFFVVLVWGITSQWKGMDSGRMKIWSLWYNLPQQINEKRIMIKHWGSHLKVTATSSYVGPLWSQAEMF